MSIKINEGLSLDECPVCNSKNIIFETTQHTVNVRGEFIEVPLSLVRCEDCGEGFEPPGFDHLNEAYIIYRKRKDMLTPKEIEAVRGDFMSCSNERFAEITGIPEQTFRIYVNGGLQDPSHDLLFKLLRDPQNQKRAVYFATKTKEV